MAWIAAIVLFAGTTDGLAGERSPGTNPEPEVRITPGAGPFYVGQWIALRTAGEGPPIRLDGALPEIVGLRLVAGAESGEPDGSGILIHATASRAGMFRIPPLTLLSGEVACRSRPLPLEIRPIPAAGRPSEFAGGVGPITGTARVAPETVTAGDWFELELAWTGPGAAGITAGVSLSGLPEGLDVRERGCDEMFAAGDPSRRFRWQLRTDRPGTVAVPPQRVATFDPASGRFFTRSTPGVRVTVAPRPTFRPEPEAQLPTRSPAASGDRGGRLGPGLVVGGLLMCGGLGFWLSRRRSRSPQRLALRLAARLETRSAEAPAALARAIESALRLYLERAGGAALATLTPAELRAVLLELGAEAELADAGARLVDRCDAAQYGAGSADLPVEAQGPALRAEAATVLRGLGRLPNVGTRAGGRTTQPAERSGTRRAV